MAYGGLRDPNVTAGELGAWRERTAGPFSARMFPGGHFFIHEQRDLWLDLLNQDLQTGPGHKGG
jgi:surfactin synthase thioesterase subunit